MLRNYFKLAWRNLMKSKAFSFINVLGLTVGITVCMMIFLFIMNEFSIDNFHVRKDNIYRVMRVYDSTKPAVPYLSGPYAPALLSDFAGRIKQAVRVMPSGDLISFQDKAFNEKKVYLADENFFNVFSFPLVRGYASEVLKNPGSVVLTESTATKYFGSVDDAMGKVVEMDKQYQLKVTGIAKDLNAGSHLDFDMVVPLSNYFNYDFLKIWINNDLFTYVLLDKKDDAGVLEQQFPRFMDKYMGADMAREGKQFSLSLTPLKDVYFEPPSTFDNVRHGDKKVVYVFLSIAILILVIACINFMNLSTIRATERSKEVGLRKVLGALRQNLIWQFLGESMLLTLISCVFAVILLFLFLPYYNQLLGYALHISWNKSPLYLFLAGIIVVVGLLAGSYPALFLSAFSPVQALRGRLRLGSSGALFRQALVVVQFSISLLLIIGTIVIMNQMRYVKHKQLGYDQSQTVLVPMDNKDVYNNRQSFKNDLLTNSEIASVSFMSGEPGGFFDAHTFEVQDHHEVQMMRTEFTDFEFAKIFGLKVIAGRDISPQYGTDSATAAIINETAARTLGWTPEQAIGKQLKNTYRDSLPRRIVGVVQDFNFLSLKENMDALVIASGNDNRVIAIKLKSGDIPAALALIKGAYSRAAPVYPFSYTFLDQKFDELYKTDLHQQHILSIFSALAIFVACLGLFGLASFAAAKRIKEIGVRKVLGSSISSIVVLLSSDLLKPVLVATCISIPVSYYIMSRWLENFAYRTPLSMWTFSLAALLTFVIALATVSIKAVGAATANPIDSLRAE